MTYINYHYKNALKAISHGEVFPLTYKTEPINPDQMVDVVKWFDGLDIDLFQGDIPSYYQELNRWLKRAYDGLKGEVSDHYSVFYDEKNWSHPWMGMKSGKGVPSYHHLLLNIHQFITTSVMKLKWYKPAHQDLAYQYMLEITHPEIHPALFMELRARICYRRVHESGKYANTLIDAPYRFVVEPSIIPVQFL